MCFSVLQDQVSRYKDYVKEEDLPSRCVQVEVVSLVARRPKPKESGSGDCPDGFVRWKGRIVRNFKKFKKVGALKTGSLHILLSDCRKFYQVVILASIS